MNKTSLTAESQTVNLSFRTAQVLPEIVNSFLIGIGNGKRVHVAKITKIDVQDALTLAFYRRDFGKSFLN